MCVSFPLLKNPTNASPCKAASNPPPRDLKVSDPEVRDLTLTKLELAPSSVLLLRFVDNVLNCVFLLPPPSSRVRSGLMAVRGFGRACPAHIGGPGTRRSEKGCHVLCCSVQPGKGLGRRGQVPKWLKLGPTFRSIVPSCPVFVTFHRREEVNLFPE